MDIYSWIFFVILCFHGFSKRYVVYLITNGFKIELGGNMKEKVTHALLDNAATLGVHWICNFHFLDELSTK